MKLIGAILGLLACVAVAAAAEPEKGEKKVEGRVYELRTYYVLPGRMKAMNARFRDHTCQLFEKHGMTIVGFWQPADPKEADTKLIYLLSHKSKEAADKSWADFINDPEWKKVREESEKDGKIVEKVERVYLNPTDYSPAK